MQVRTIDGGEEWSEHESMKDALNAAAEASLREDVVSVAVHKPNSPELQRRVRAERKRRRKEQRQSRKKNRQK